MRNNWIVRLIAAGFFIQGIGQSLTISARVSHNAFLGQNTPVGLYSSLLGISLIAISMLMINRIPSALIAIRLMGALRLLTYFAACGGFFLSWFRPSIAYAALGAIAVLALLAGIIVWKADRKGPSAFRDYLELRGAAILVLLLLLFLLPYLKNGTLNGDYSARFEGIVRCMELLVGFLFNYYVFLYSFKPEGESWFVKPFKSHSNAILIITGMTLLLTWLWSDRYWHLTNWSPPAPFLDLMSWVGFFSPLVGLAFLKESRIVWKRSLIAVISAGIVFNLYPFVVFNSIQSKEIIILNLMSVSGWLDAFATALALGAICWVLGNAFRNRLLAILTGAFLGIILIYYGASYSWGSSERWLIYLHILLTTVVVGAIMPSRETQSIRLDWKYLMLGSLPATAVLLIVLGLCPCIRWMIDFRSFGTSFGIFSWWLRGMSLCVLYALTSVKWSRLKAIMIVGGVVSLLISPGGIFKGYLEDLVERPMMTSLSLAIFWIAPVLAAWLGSLVIDHGARNP